MSAAAPAASQARRVAWGPVRSLLVVPTPLRAQRIARRLCDAEGGVLFGARVVTPEGLLPGLASPSVIPLAHAGMIAIHAVVGADDVWGLLPRLKGAGASGILVLPIEKLIA